MPTLDRYVAREIAARLGGVLAVVLAIYLARRLGSLLAEAIDGTIAPAYLFRLLLLRTLVALPSLLPVTLALGVLLGVGRLYQDGEVVALESCGVPESRVLRSAFAAGMVFCAFIAVAALWARPVAAGKFHEARRLAGATLRFGGLAPGRFYVLGKAGSPVVFAEERSADGVAGVFVYTQRHSGRMTVLSARRAADRLGPRGEARFLTLADGYRYDLKPGDGEYEVTRYADLTLRWPLPREERSAARRVRPTLELLGSERAEDQAEVQWRLSMPVAAAGLLLLALALARVEPGRAPYGRAVGALLVYVGYRNALGLAKEWLEDGLLPPSIGLWAVHAAFLAVVVVLWVWGRRQSPLRPRRG